MRDFLLIVRRALLMIVRFIEQRRLAAARSGSDEHKRRLSAEATRDR